MKYALTNAIQLSLSPRILLLPDFLTPSELKHFNRLIDTTYPSDFRPSKSNSISRTSHSLRIGFDHLPRQMRVRLHETTHLLMRGHYDYNNIYIIPAQEPRAVYYENTRKILQTPHHPSLSTDVESHFELPKLTVYNKNERFDVHRDSIHPQSTSRHHQQRGRLPYANGTYSNRLITMLMYLNDVKEGGATVFPSLNLSVNPKAGACLVFFRVLAVFPHPMPERHIVPKKWLMVRSVFYSSGCGRVLTKPTKT